MLALRTDAMMNRALFLLLLGFINRCQAEILLVYPKLLQSRAEDGSLVLHIHDNLKLILQKSSVLAPQLLLRDGLGNNSDEVVLNGRELERNLYHDNKHQSSVLVKQLQGDLEVRGILNHELRIEPLPAAKRSDDGTTLHKVFKVKERMAKPRQSRRWSPDSLWQSWRRRQRPSRVTEAPIQANKLFVVELCIVTSQGYWKAFKSTEEMILYLAVLLNAVTLRYVDMKSPEIRFQLNGVTKSQDDRLMARKSYGLDISDTLKNVKQSLTQSDNSHCDLVFLITEEDFVSVTGGKVESNVCGLAYVGSICDTDRVAVGEDKPHSYDGAYTMAHEMCHSLGATHDGNPPIKYIKGHPGAEKCPWRQGYLMSYEDGGVKKYTLSPCSIAQVRVFTRTLSSICIQVTYRTTYKSPQYPGQRINDSKFCDIMHPRDRGVMPYNRNEESYKNCKLECCWITGESYGRRSYRCREYFMAEAMTCSGKMTCRRGVCGNHNWQRPYENRGR